MSYARKTIFDPNATGAKFSFFWIFRSGLSSIMKAKPAVLQLASVIRTSCFSGLGCFNASSQASLSALFNESKVFLNSDVMLTGTSALKSS